MAGLHHLDLSFHGQSIFFETVREEHRAKVHCVNMALPGMDERYHISLFPRPAMMVLREALEVGVRQLRSRKALKKGKSPRAASACADWRREKDWQDVFHATLFVALDELLKGRDLELVREDDTPGDSLPDMTVLLRSKAEQSGQERMENARILLEVKTAIPDALIEAILKVIKGGTLSYMQQLALWQITVCALELGAGAAISSTPTSTFLLIREDVSDDDSEEGRDAEEGVIVCKWCRFWDGIAMKR